MHDPYHYIPALGIQVLPWQLDSMETCWLSDKVWVSPRGYKVLNFRGQVAASFQSNVLPFATSVILLHRHRDVQKSLAPAICLVHLVNSHAHLPCLLSTVGEQIPQHHGKLQ